MAILRKGKLIGVCIHHSVYKPANNLEELKAQAKLFDSWHKSKEWAETIKTNGEFGYKYIEYHYLLGLDGSLLQVQDEKYVLYHAGDNFRGDLSFNLHGIAICLTGNYENDKPTEAQMLTLVKLIRDIQNRYKIDALVRGHKETSQTPTACPGKNIGTSSSGWLKEVIKNVNNQAYPPTTLPEPPQQTECEKEVERLKTENKGLSDELVTLKSQVEKLENDLKLQKDRVGFLEGSLKERDEEIKELESSFDTLKKEKDRLEKEKLEIQEQFDKYKQENNSSFVNPFVKVFDKIIDFIKRKVVK